MQLRWGGESQRRLSQWFLEWIPLFLSCEVGRYRWGGGSSQSGYRPSSLHTCLGLALFAGQGRYLEEGRALVQSLLLCGALCDERRCPALLVHSQA